MNTFFFDDVQYPEGLFGGKDFFNPIIYSTEEREVGVWTNGKPLYAKTFIQQLSGNAGQVDISACGADMMFAYSGYYDIGVTMLGLNERLNNQYLTYTHVNLDTMQYIDCCNTIATNSKIIVCCLYTKINDVAGSGSYTTLGIPAHHYDGNEKVIGTWFGETLYEKIINFDYNNIQSRTSSGCEIYINVPNIKDTKDSVILFEGGIIQFPYFVNTSIFIGGFTQTETDTLHISLRYSSSVYNELNAYLTDCRVKLQYTKTS